MNQVSDFDIEEALDFRRKVRELTRQLTEATEKELAARSEYAKARSNRTKALNELRAYTERDMKPLPLFDRVEHEPGTNGTVKPEAAPEPPPADKPTWINVDGAARLANPSTPPKVELKPLVAGSRFIQSLSVKDYPCELWMRPGGRYVLLADEAQFGNWSRTDLADTEYSPTWDEIELAIAGSTGLKIRSGAVEFSHHPGTLEMDFGYCDNHPEPWRRAKLADIIRSKKTSSTLLKKANLQYLGELEWWICEEEHGLTELAGITEKAEEAALTDIAQWWVFHGTAGKMPGWLKPYAEAKPS